MGEFETVMQTQEAERILPAPRVSADNSFMLLIWRCDQVFVVKWSPENLLRVFTDADAQEDDCSS